MTDSPSPPPRRRALSLPLALLLLVLLGGGVGGGLLASGALDRQAPALSAALPDKATPYRGEVPLTVTASDRSPGLSRLTVQLDDLPPRSLPLDQATLRVPVDTAGLADGAHVIRVEGLDGAWGGNRAAAEVRFMTDNTLPALSLSQRSLRARQGHTLAVVLQAGEPLARLEVEVLGKARPMYRVGPGVWRALVGVPIRQEAGPSPVHILAEDAAGNVLRAEVPLQVEGVDFPAGGYIRLSAAQKAARQDDQRRAATRKERSDVYRRKDAAQRWAGPMQLPLEGRRTSGFGRYRTYSDGKRSYHSGTDIAQVTGTPVAAAAPGVVRQAGWEHIFGNVVIVDHGQGVSTSYNHLSAVGVAVGDVVAAGDVVGEVGSTGQSTGPHLHWGLVVDGVAVDATEWLEEDFDASGYLGDLVPLSQIEGGAAWDGGGE